MDGGAWWAAVHGIAKSRTWLSDFTFTFPFHALEKEMATHSSVLAWRIPGTGKPGGLLSLGLHKVRHDWSDLAVAAAAGCDSDLVEGKASHLWGPLSITYFQLVFKFLTKCQFSWQLECSSYFIMRQTYMHFLEHLKIETTIIYLWVVLPNKPWTKEELVFFSLWYYA